MSCAITLLAISGTVFLSQFFLLACKVEWVAQFFFYNANSRKNQRQEKNAILIKKSIFAPEDLI